MCMTVASLLGAVPEGEPAHASADVRTVAPDSSVGTAVDALFGMGVRQRTITVSGTRAERTQDTRTFQVAACSRACSLPCSHHEGLAAQAAMRTNSDGVKGLVAGACRWSSGSHSSSSRPTASRRRRRPHVQAAQQALAAPLPPLGGECCASSPPDDTPCSRAMVVRLKHAPQVAASRRSPALLSAVGCNEHETGLRACHRDAAAGQGETPTFGQLLADSLRGDGGTQRGWFDDERRYQLLQQSRCPTALPQVHGDAFSGAFAVHMLWRSLQQDTRSRLCSGPEGCHRLAQVMVVSCGMPAGGPLWWRAPSDSSAVPWALAIETDLDDCKVT
jgi:hypothetical protein